MQWGVAYYRAPDGLSPAVEFLSSCPTKVAANIFAVVEAVRAAPPPAFSGGGKWEAMHGAMSGYYEVRSTGPGRVHYRLFCVLENGTPEDLEALGFDRPHIVAITGMTKTNASLFTDREYAKNVRALGDDYVSRKPRPVVA
jgi:Txe/YoeB family toxin of Txe-Axe toxin-antitoxin module